MATNNIDLYLRVLGKSKAIGDIKEITKTVEQADKISASKKYGYPVTGAESSQAILDSLLSKNAKTQELNKELIESLRKSVGEYSTTTKVASENIKKMVPPIIKAAYSGPIPPTIAAVQQQKMNNLLAGAISTFTNPYLAARSFVAGFGGGSSGSGGGFGRSGFGGGPGGFLPAAVALAAVEASAKLLRFAFNELIGAIKNGAKLYQDAARAGRSPGKLFGLQQALSVAGITNVEELLLNTQFAGVRRSGGSFLRPNRSYIPGAQEFEGELLSAGRRSGISQGDLQAIKNLSPYIHQFAIESKQAASIMQDTSGALFRTNNAWMGFMRDLKAAFSELAGELSIVLIPLLIEWTNQVKALNFILANSQWGILLRVLKQFHPSDDFGQTSTGSNRIAANAMQRIGFVFNGGYTGVTDAPKRTAANTAKTVNLLESIKALLTTAGGGAAGRLNSLP